MSQELTTALSASILMVVLEWTSVPVICEGPGNQGTMSKIDSAFLVWLLCRVQACFCTPAVVGFCFIETIRKIISTSLY